MLCIDPGYNPQYSTGRKKRRKPEADNRRRKVQILE
jgi:hypothetical protein